MCINIFKLGVVNALRHSARVTPLVEDLLQTLSSKDKRRIDTFLSTPNSRTHVNDTTSKDSATSLVFFESDLVQIVFDANEGVFRLIRVDGTTHVSTISNVEEISYVSSPYLPRCLIRTQAAFSKDAHFAERCKEGINAIQDELSFALQLSDVHLMIGEWIPFGPNVTLSLNNRLGSLDRCQGGLFTCENDPAPTETRLEISPGLTKIVILDFEFDSFINVEADIHIPHSESLVQIEGFGMHLHGDGSVVYGMHIDAILDQTADCVYVDHLSRLLVDVDLDSSKILNDLLTRHQRDLMEMLYMNDAQSRNKLSLITATKISPNLNARDYLDRAEMENELKQIIGETHSVFDLSDDDKIIIGREGMLVLGPGWIEYEDLIITQLALLSRELFIRCFFRRTFILDNMMNQARAYITTLEQDPESLAKMRHKIDHCSHDLIFLEEILELLQNSVHGFCLPPCPKSPTGKLLYHQLELEKTLKDLAFRCEDLARLLGNFRAKLKQVQCQNGTLSKTKLVNRSFTKSSLIWKTWRNCTLVCAVLDNNTDADLGEFRITSEAYNQWVERYFDSHMRSNPSLRIVMTVLLMTLFTWQLQCGINWYSVHCRRSQSVTYSLHRKLNVPAIEAFVKSRDLESCTRSLIEGASLVHIVWRSSKHGIFRWKQGFPRGLQMHYRTAVTYDATNQILLDVSFEGKLVPTRKDVFTEFISLLFRNGCFDEDSTVSRKLKQSKAASMRSIALRESQKIYPTI
ncbi:unnamed protein product [Albugo candida]|uniref:Uncharacterized protein n=1 Tax=Albugo candida TaxID=65357 RepID=A0A024FWF1_9STRA|nr:unnamed protein product [Albugo candida]|eukprot:CCI11445.1 unnamed protein product [Albugo candida]